MTKELIETHKLQYFEELSIWKTSEGDYIAFNKRFNKYPNPFAEEKDLDKLKEDVSKKLKDYIADELSSVESHLNILKNIKKENWLEKISQTPEVNSEENK